MTAKFDFESLPVLYEGESKQTRLWRVGQFGLKSGGDLVAIRFKPTVYSFTNNRYGIVPGTDYTRLRCSSTLLQQMTHGDDAISTAFVAEVNTDTGPILIQKRIVPCNLEVRVKRYHIGSPVHRYKFSDLHPSITGDPVRKWTRFNDPLICFDWRNPLQDEDGTRLADEPISDDYASLWMSDIPGSKALAKKAFLWLERRFSACKLTLIDICFLIDKTGTVIYGEISPDCMRVRIGLGDPAHAGSFDKDNWRSGSSPFMLAQRYVGICLELGIPVDLRYAVPESLSEVA